MQQLTAAKAAKYYGCEVKYPFGLTYPVSAHTLGNLEDEPEIKLILRPLSKITDEDAHGLKDIFDFEITIEEAKILANDLRLSDSESECYIKGNLVAKTIDYLRSRGYDCDNYLVTGEAVEDGAV